MDERQRSDSHAYFAAVVESSDDAIITKSTDDIIRSCNPAAERIFGYGADELIGKSVRILIPPDRRQEEDEILRRVRRGDRVDHYETVRLRKDGRPIDVSLSVSPILDASGAVVGVAKVARDISEQKRLARELAAQREWFRVTLASIGDAVLACDADGRISFANLAAEELTGWPMHDAVGRDLADVFRIVDEKTREPVQNPAALVMRSGHVVDLANHTLLIGKDGAERPIADSGAPIWSAGGEIIGAVLVFRDVTAERRAEEAMAEQREWFETTLESIGDAVIATDVCGCVAFMNPVAEHLTGWRLRDARGRPCTDVFDIVNENTRLSVESPVTRVLAEGVVVGLVNHTLLIAADGTERPIDDSGAPIRGRDGRIVGVVLVFRDISERRRAEAERRLSAVERERLLEAERVARAEAERASRLKDEFVAMVSHELRTPLNAILGWSRLMMQSPEDPEVIRRGLDVICRNTDTQAQLISDLLDMSRIVSGTLRLDFERVDLKSLVQGAIETVQHSAEQKRITILPELGSTAPIAGDPGRLQQIVWNLLWNAIKFTPENGRISVRLRRSGSDAELTVSDTGVGIRPEFLPHIFERFRQENVSITRHFGGLGLGLSIVKHLVDLHGGSIEAESPGQGRGATFTIRLPSGTLPAASTSPHHVSTARHVPRPADALEGIRVLVVEDEKDTRDLLCRFLTGHGADVVIAASAREALELVPEANANFLISDIGLPDMDGYELLQCIRRADANPAAGIPAIALTAYARPHDRMLAFRAGYQAHLAKPVDPAELITAIAELAKASRSGSQEGR